MNGREASYRKYGRVIIGKGSLIDKDVTIGYPSRDVLLTKGQAHSLATKIGPRCILRSGCVVYATAHLGSNVELGHNVVVREKVRIGEYSKIGCFSEIAPSAVIGPRCRITGRAYISNGMKFGKRVFVGPDFSTANRAFSKAFMEQREDDEPINAPIVDDDVLIGAHVTLNPGIRIGKGCVIAAGCMVTKDVPPGSLVAGVPGSVIGSVADAFGSGKR